MVIATRDQAARRAEASSRNEPGMCQAWTRGIYGAPSVGDIDRDGDADAVDGWRAEDKDARRPGDRNPPRGVPLSWSGGRAGHGHRAISLGNRKVRSIDIGSPGRVGTVDLDFFEDEWNLKYLGWTTTISGIAIPLGIVEAPRPNPKPVKVPAKKSIDQLAREVINGKWGNGQERLKRLTAAGYNAAKVQDRVNDLLR